MTDPTPDPNALDPAAVAALVEQVRALSEEVFNLRKEGRVLSTTVERVAGTAARSAQGLDEFEASLSEISARLAADVAAAPGPSNAGPTPAEQAAPPAPAAAEIDELDMKVLMEWVIEHIGNWAQRKLARTSGSATGWLWCSYWYEHPEAVTILWLLRRAWLEAVSQPGAALFVYFRDCYYPALRLIGDPTGPFHGCTHEEHKDSPFVPVYPRGFFDPLP
ncbi:DUF4913 domain-containing protein [Nocardia camponoti]|uniref:DUF4913 domain-containing protein n=1 Tax=Nocardia camponoti TaxID=1616106 RepID=A0A917QUB4_9NOCA|nr:DUF4913 domain-containing protein [Nocardia camponoti]GGK68805.1 hypothetical protein GCM10011591_46160 [Nocardia camponoti]